jgi:hypothetical protein
MQKNASGFMPFSSAAAMALGGKSICGSKLDALEPGSVLVRRGGHRVMWRHRHKKIGEQRIAVIEERPRRQFTANQNGKLEDGVWFGLVWFGLVWFGGLFL